MARIPKDQAEDFLKVAEASPFYSQTSLARGDETSDCDPSILILSRREIEVLGWVRHGKTNWEIAQILHLSEYTVKNHVRNILRKLGVINRAQAVGRLMGLPTIRKSQS